MSLHNKHSEDLFSKIRNKFDKISMIDDQGRVTLIGANAKIFNMLFSKNNSDTMVSLSLMDPDVLKIYFNRNMSNILPDVDKERWFEFLSSLRSYTVTRQMAYDLVDLDNSGLTASDIKAMIQTKKHNETMAESRFSPMSGSKRSSIQTLERVKIKVKHGDIIKDDVHGARSRNIRALFIENNLGERFRFPFLNLSGVRAMARHLDEGGDWNDRTGQHILETAYNLNVIKKFIREVHQQKICSSKSLTLLEMLREKQINYRRNLKLMNGSRGYKVYTQNLAETYIEPVTEVGSYFTSIPESVAVMLPQIERILGEKTIENAVDRSVAECVRWINARTLTEAPQQPNQPQPGPPQPPQPSQPQPGQPQPPQPGQPQPPQPGQPTQPEQPTNKMSGIKIPPGVRRLGSQEQLSVALLEKIQGVEIPSNDEKSIKQYASAQVPDNVKQRLEYDRANNKFEMPVYSKAGEDGLAPQDSYQTIKLLFLISVADHLSDVPVFIISRPSLLGRFLKGVQVGMDPVGTVKGKARELIYRRSGQ